MQVTLSGEPTQEQKPRYKREEWLREQYVEQGKNTYEIGDMADCHNSTVRKYLNKHGIETRTRGKQTSKKLRREEWLREQYVERGKTTNEIADMIDCSGATVGNHINKHGIKIRTGGEHASVKLRREDWLREQYVEQGKTTVEIADMIDCSGSTVSRYLHKHGIEPRDGSEQVPDKLKDKGWLCEQYVEQRKTSYEIADMADSSHSTVRRYLNNHGIEIRSSPTDLSGADHPNYAGGHPEYGPGWNDEKKRAVRERDGNACRNCDMSQEQHRRQYDQRLHVHHITKAREFDDADKRNAMSNLVTLCRDCHFNTFERLADTGLQPQIPGVNYPDD